LYIVSNLTAHKRVEVSRVGLKYSKQKTADRITNLGREVNTALQYFIIWDAVLGVRCIFPNQVVRFSE